MGAAEILGIQLMENFDAPYFSRSAAEFWRRWHISLSTWFRDYLYFPLGGSRKGKVRTQINKMIVFFVSGLWHGAQWNYVIWGGLNGLYQVAGELLMPVRDRAVKMLHLNREALSHKWMKIAVTFFMIDFSWIFFRANSVREAFSIIKNMFTVRNPWILFDGSLYTVNLDSKNFQIIIWSILILLAADFCKYRGIKIREVLQKQEYWFRWLLIAVSASLILLLGVWGSAYNEANFIYFQF